MRQIRKNFNFCSDSLARPHGNPRIIYIPLSLSSPPPLSVSERTFLIKNPRLRPRLICRFAAGRTDTYSTDRLREELTLQGEASPSPLHPRLRFCSRFSSRDSSLCSPLPPLASSASFIRLALFGGARKRENSWRSSDARGNDADRDLKAAFSAEEKRPA